MEKQAAAGKGFYGSVAFRHEAPSRKSPQQLEHVAASTPLPPDIKLPRLSCSVLGSVDISKKFFFSNSCDRNETETDGQHGMSVPELTALVL